MADARIDRRVAPLVAALNGIPGVRTFASCGGHRNPKARLGQVPSDSFYVSFQLQHSSRGWTALSRIGWIVSEASSGLADLKAWTDDQGLAFILEGRGVHPGQLVTALTDSMKGR